MILPSGYRKMVLAVLFTLIGLGVELTTKNGLSLTLVQFLLGVYGTFAAGNMFEHYCQRPSKSSGPVSIPAALPTQSPIVHTDPLLHEKADHILQAAQITQEAIGFIVNYIRSFQNRTNPTQPSQNQGTAA